MAIKHFLDYFFGGHICERWMPGGDDVGFRSHLAWARRRNTNLKHLTTNRCLKSTVLVALMIRTNNMIVFSNSDIAIVMRLALAENAYDKVVFWLGISLGVSQFISVFALIANFTAYSVFNSLSKENAPIILRSSVGRYASQLPSDLVYWSFRAFFLVAFLTFAAIVEPEAIGICVIILMVLVIVHVLHVNLSLSHVVINSGAMGHDPILRTHQEENMLPDELSETLIHQMKLGRKAKIPLRYQYTVPYQTVLRQVDHGIIKTPIGPEDLKRMQQSRYTKRWRNN